jgi:FdhD protein
MRVSERPERSVAIRAGTGGGGRLAGMARGAESTTGARLWRVEEGRAEARPDLVATEEPLEIRLRWPGGGRTVAVTMRTPGADEELALGFLFAEGVIDGAGRVEEVAAVEENVVEVALGAEPQLATLERHFFTSSACGVCGKAGLKGLALRADPPPPGPVVRPEVICSLPESLCRSQGLFAETGGLHAAALFDSSGRLLDVREDVGRHNALDKLVGSGLRAGMLPFHDRLVLVSGRTSYEILQKCLVAGVPVVCAVSAPSSLAVELAQGFGVTLIGFLRGRHFNVYSGLDRLAGAAPRL